jgi:hypothetical protein
MYPPIVSTRLILQSLNADVMNALLRRDTLTAAQMLECEIPADALLNRLPLAMRLEQLRIDASEQPWLLRVMGERTSRTMIGHIGFPARGSGDQKPPHVHAGLRLQLLLPNLRHNSLRDIHRRQSILDTDHRPSFLRNRFDKRIQLCPQRFCVVDF